MKRSKFFNLNWTDLGKGLLIAFLTALLGGLLELLQAGTIPTTWVAFQPILEVSLSAAVAYLLKNLFTNSEGQIARGEKSAAEFRAKRAGGTLKTILLLAILLPMGLGANAQSKWDGFFKPVTMETLQKAQGQKALPGAFLFRPTAALVATEYRLTDDGINSNYLSKTGVGISYAHYIESEGEPFNNYSINGLLMFPTAGQTNLGMAVTVSALRYINLGLGYDFVKGTPFKQNLFFLTGVQYTF
jgi:hypothetical protein